jgi:cell wall-associated NlpC family hydrolase
VSSKLDPRRHPFRDDLAAIALEGRAAAARFVTGEEMQVIEGIASLRRRPGHDQPLDTEILFGERFTVYDSREGWAWGQLETDGYVGYVPVSALGQPGRSATHWVNALRTYIFPEPDIKIPPMQLAPMNAQLRVADVECGFARLAGGGFVFAGHIAKVDEPAPDFVAVAARYIGTPYLWGGRTSIGIDCSGLVQTALNAAGIDCPRDTDMQMAELGTAIDRGAPLARGDLVFWQGHVGIMQDDKILLHANAHHMMCASEPLADTSARINANTGDDVLSIRRL